MWVWVGPKHDPGQLTDRHWLVLCRCCAECCAGVVLRAGRSRANSLTEVGAAGSHGSDASGAGRPLYTPKYATVLKHKMFNTELKVQLRLYWLRSYQLIRNSLGRSALVLYICPDHDHFSPRLRLSAFLVIVFPLLCFTCGSFPFLRPSLLNWCALDLCDACTSQSTGRAIR